MTDIMDKIHKLYELSKSDNDNEAQAAMARAQVLMAKHRITEDQIFKYAGTACEEKAEKRVIYTGRPHNWMYQLAGIIARNFRCKHYYHSYKNGNSSIHFVGLSADIDIAEVTYNYAFASIKQCARDFMNRKEIHRKYKRKWILKQDYISGYLTGLATVFEK